MSFNTEISNIYKKSRNELTEKKNKNMKYISSPDPLSHISGSVIKEDIFKKSKPPNPKSFRRGNPPNPLIFNQKQQKQPSNPKKKTYLSIKELKFCISFSISFKSKLDDQVPKTPQKYS